MSAIQDAINKVGRAVVADACGVSPQAVHKWLTKGVPAERVLDVESVTGISRHEIRPDIFGPPDAKPARKVASA